MSWKQFAEACPEIAALGFEKLNRKICYLALLNETGAPRIHPITPFIGDGILFMFTEPTSPKIRDLQHDGRYAIHCAVARDGPLVEFLVSGSAVVISDPDVRAQAEHVANSPVVDNGYALFEFQVEHVLVVEYDEDKNKTICHWHCG